MGTPGFFSLVLVIDEATDELAQFAQPCQRRQIRVKQHGQDLTDVVHAPR